MANLETMEGRWQMRRIPLASLVLAVWLLVSAFLWTHNPWPFENSWSVGALGTTAAGLALCCPPIRYATALLGLWLLLSTLLGPRSSPATLWNNTLVGVGMVAFSLTMTKAIHKMRRRPT
jgi:hypothetical protein